MKNKGQKVFLLIFVLLISFMSVTIVGLYDNAKGYDSNKVNRIQDYYKEQFQIFTFDLAEKLDPSYDPLIFSSKLSGSSVMDEAASSSSAVPYKME